MMKNSILFTVAFLIVIGFFIYATNMQTRPALNNTVYLVKTDVATKAASVNGEPVEKNIKSLDDYLPNSQLLKDFEIIDEAELLLSMDDAQQISDGLMILKIMADRKSGRANYILAELYAKGIRVDASSEEALKYYKQAALLGVEDANIYLFNYYLDADEMTEEHLNNALSWFLEASRVGNNPIADYALAHIYSKGLGVEVDIVEATKYYKKAADENFVLAYEPLANLYLVEKDDPKKISDALMLFQRAANEDIPTAQFKLGYMYAEGLGVKQDYDTVRFWYQRAANHKLIEAYMALGLIYENALGTEKDNQIAYDYYRKAAEAGSILGQNAVARAFERGIGVDKDIDRASFWYSQAAEQGDSNAAYNLGRIFEEYDEMRNLDIAKFWYQKAADANILEAKQALSRLEGQQ